MPEPGGEKPAVLPETQPPFVNRRFPFFRSKPQKRSEKGARKVRGRAVRGAGGTKRYRF